MQRTQIREILQHIFEGEIDSELGEFRDDMVLAQEFKLDSVDYMSLIMRVEESFHIRLSNGELNNFVNIGSLVDLVQVKVDSLSESQAVRRAA
jgi:acyl carrier protein